VIGFALVGCQQSASTAAQAPAARRMALRIDADGTAQRHTRRPDAFHRFRLKRRRISKDLTHRSTASEPLEDRRQTNRRVACQAVAEASVSSR